MALGSGIEWTESTWNPVTGCNKISPGSIRLPISALGLAPVEVASGLRLNLSTRERSAPTRNPAQRLTVRRILCLTFPFPRRLVSLRSLTYLGPVSCPPTWRGAGATGARVCRSFFGSRCWWRAGWC